jgi:hypothetical protein
MQSLLWLQLIEHVFGLLRLNSVDWFLTIIAALRVVTPEKV